ncbi:hypothetical protein [Azospirillum brasilense]|uniref:Uncharacterized protein n=1 Tax=Azospirillum brasilense TaxID=192 RepID=A0A235HD94_AZOBR|nr:hypothetical protein [Azospirillum brasilense]OYD83728.1 hypothetical protein CHT98_14680 [Azospirillum brasilense]
MSPKDEFETAAEYQARFADNYGSLRIGAASVETPLMFVEDAAERVRYAPEAGVWVMTVPNAIERPLKGQVASTVEFTVGSRREVIHGSPDVHRLCCSGT